MSATIEVSNVNAVHKLSIPLPEGGGVVVLRGGHGVGKSGTIRALDALASGRGSEKLQVRDGAARGEISGCGVRLTVGKRTSRSGELEVTSLDGRLSVADLVDPGLVSETAADAKRIKSLVQLAGVQADPILFHELFGSPEEFNAVVPSDSIQTDDILQLADKVKRAIDKEALKIEGKANVERSHANACSEAANGIDLEQDSDPDILSARLEAAIRRESELSTKRREALAQNRRIEDAREQLERAKQSDDGIELRQYRERETFAHNELNDAAAAVERIEHDLALAKIGLERAQQHHERTKADLDSAERYAATVASWEKTLQDAGDAIEPPTQAELDEAALAVLSARKSIENGALIRSARSKLEKRETHLAEVKRLDLQAEGLRNAAANVDSVLSNQIAKLGCPLKVEKGRLVTETDRGIELYAELSEGERWRIALDIAIDAVGPNGLLTVPQVAWEGLNSKSRKAIAEHVRSRGAVLITAEVTDDDELTATPFSMTA